MCVRCLRATSQPCACPPRMFPRLRLHTIMSVLARAVPRIVWVLRRARMRVQALGQVRAWVRLMRTWTWTRRVRGATLGLMRRQRLMMRLRRSFKHL